MGINIFQLTPEDAQLSTEWKHCIVPQFSKSEMDNIMKVLITGIIQNW